MVAQKRCGLSAGVESDSMPSTLVGVGDPKHVGVKEEKENHDDGHQVHIDEEQDAAVIQAPPGLHAAERVDRADDRDQRGDEEQRGGTDVGEVRQKESGAKAEKDQRATA